MDYQFYMQNVERIKLQLTPSEFRTLLMAEGFDLELARIFAELLEKFVVTEDYLYCAAIRDWFVRNRAILNELLGDE